MFKITVDNATTHEVVANEEGLKLNDVTVSWDLVATGPNAYHVLWNNKSYNVQVVKADAAAKQFVLRVNGTDYTLEAQDKYDLLLSKLGMSNLTASKLADIKAPMPGLVLQVIATEGQTLKKGDQVLILEAMKMENVLKSSGDGVVKAIKVKQGQTVDKNQVLVELE